MRSYVIQEIMEVERSYTKQLEDICQGYIVQCRNHPNMFSNQQLRVIFGNIESIFQFQRKFLHDLESRYNRDQPDLSEIGACFLEHSREFAVYSDFCNSYQAGSDELKQLMQQDTYKYFFEACRLLQQMSDLPINGILIAPVQRICKYPLQLEDLLKRTPKDHNDYVPVSEALEQMRNVAVLINERKRRFESINALAHWQVSIHRWLGPDVVDSSSEMIHSGEVVRIDRGGKTQQRVAFLLEHQMIFCKKDTFRKDYLCYRGRLDMDLIKIEDLPDGWNAELGLEVRNAIRLYDATAMEFVCVLCCRKGNDKQRWLEAFAKERNTVSTDQDADLEISREQRKQALVNARIARFEQIKRFGYIDRVLHHKSWSLHQSMNLFEQATKGKTCRQRNSVARCSFFKQ